MTPHVFKPDPHGRPHCDAKYEEDGRRMFCGQKLEDEVHQVASEQYTFTKEQRATAVDFLEEMGCYDEEDDAELANWLAQLLADGSAPHVAVAAAADAYLVAHADLARGGTEPERPAAAQRLADAWIALTRAVEARRAVTA